MCEVKSFRPSVNGSTNKTVISFALPVETFYWTKSEQEIF